MCQTSAAVRDSSSLPLQKSLTANLEVDLVVAKLSLHGCYVNTPNTLAIDSKVSIKIFVESECFAATAKVVYSLPNSCTGLAFEEVSAKSGKILRQWLLKAGGRPERL